VLVHDLGLDGVLQVNADALKAATGWHYTADELRDVGERAMQLERAFNIRHGLTPEDDWNVPDRLIVAPVDGPGKGMAIKDHLKGMILEYYRLMGWDLKTGKPYRDTLIRLGLDDAARELWG